MYMYSLLCSLCFTLQNKTKNNKNFIRLFVFFQHHVTLILYSIPSCYNYVKVATQVQTIFSWAATDIWKGDRSSVDDKAVQ